MYWEEASTLPSVPILPYSKVERAFGETENDAQESFISPFLASFLDGVVH